MANMNDKKARPVSARKPVKRKPKEKPKRPLSAYNFFFKEEREKIIKAVTCEDGIYWKEIDPELSEDLVKKLRKDSGKVSFEEIGRIIGRRWKDIDSNRFDNCKARAKDDAERYKRDMEKYNQKQEDMRKQARKAPVHQVPPPAALSGMYDGHMGYTPGYHRDPNSQHGYGQMHAMGSYSRYYMSTPSHHNECHFGHSVPQQTDSSSNFMNGSASHPNGPPSMGFSPQGEYSYAPDVRGSDYYGPPSMGFSSQGEYPYAPDVRSSDHYFYAQQQQGSSHTSDSNAYQTSYARQSCNFDEQGRSW